MKHLLLLVCGIALAGCATKPSRRGTWIVRTELGTIGSHTGVKTNAVRFRPRDSHGHYDNSPQVAILVDKRLRLLPSHYAGRVLQVSGTLRDGEPIDPSTGMKYDGIVVIAASERDIHDLGKAK